MAAKSPLELFSLKGKRALVTGASRGIGFALARGLGRAGAAVVMNARNPDQLSAAADKLRAEDIEVVESVFDVTKPESVEASVSLIESECGPIHILVNNAGMQHRASLEEFPDEMFDAMMKLNVYGVYYMAKAVAHRMIPRRAGKIINIASVQSALARATIAPYTASKGAVSNLTKGMCADWAMHGIQINAIAPGYMKTEMTAALVANAEFSAWVEGRTPAARWGEVDELVGAAVFLASDASSYVNGHTLYVDGGMTTRL